MKKYIRLTFALCCVLMASCAQPLVKDTAATRVSRDYEAKGDARGIHPFIYGKHTLIELQDTPLWLIVKDENGVRVEYKKEGRYYSLDRILDNFTISTGVHKIAFSLAQPEELTHEPPLGPLMDPRQQALEEPESTTTPVILRAQEPQPTGKDEQVFSLMKNQLKQYRQLLQNASSNHKVTGDELQILSKKLDGMENKMAVGVAIVHVNFSRNGVIPTPDDNALNIALDAARLADRINIYGRTSSVVAGKNDPRIAMSRAVNIKKYLADHGVMEHKIHVSSLPEGDFIASPRLKQANAINQRAAIEIING